MNNFNIIRHAGTIKEIIDHRGKKHTRQPYLLFKLGEEIKLLECVDDPDHMLFQSNVPISNEDLITKYGGTIPVHMRGACVTCSCGSDAVCLVNGPHAFKIMCRTYATYGRHQTSFDLSENKLKLDKQTKDRLYMGDSDFLKTLKEKE